MKEKLENHPAAAADTTAVTPPSSFRPPDDEQRERVRAFRAECGPLHWETFGEARHARLTKTMTIVVNLMGDALDDALVDHGGAFAIDARQVLDAMNAGKSDAIADRGAELRDRIEPGELVMVFLHRDAIHEAESVARWARTMEHAGWPGTANGIDHGTAHIAGPDGRPVDLLRKKSGADLPQISDEESGADLHQISGALSSAEGIQ